jgi:hypothetical protein
MPWERDRIVDTAPNTPLTPLTTPKWPLRGDRSSALESYPDKYATTIKPDGTVAFPQGTVGKLRGGSILVDGVPVAGVTPLGEVSGSGLKKHYHFTDDGDLLDAEGHGIRVMPNGGIRGVGGKWHYKDVFIWAMTDGGHWDGTGWRTVALVSLLVIENLLPEAIGADAADAGAK